MALSEPPRPILPSRGEIWFIEFFPSIGKEIKDPHPALVVSVDELNRSAWGLIVVCPITTARKQAHFRLHVPLAPPAVKRPSVIRCDQVKSLSAERFIKRLGGADGATMQKVEFILKKVLGL